MGIETIESTNKLLRVIIALILKRKDADTFTLRQQIEILNDLGLKPLEIAEILGRRNIYINKELSKLRKRRKEKEEFDGKN
jgi:hypothetical protein